MRSPSVIDRFRRHAVPLVLFAIVVIVVLAVPPIVLGEVTARTYALTAAVLIIAVGAVFPFAALVAVGTLPLLYVGIASFAAPRASSDGALVFSGGTALRHVAAGVSYVLAAAAVGAIGIGAEMAVGNDFTTIPALLHPVFLSLGGVIVGTVFVCLQLWRYDTPAGALPRRTVLGTAALGGLLALSPIVSLWMFDGVG